jgi:hypothetical protein
MSFARHGRDTAASLYYLKCLDELREEHLRLSIDGKKVSPHFFVQGEARALERTRHEYFTRAQRNLIMPPATAQSTTDTQDFETRTTRLIEAGMLESHRKLAAIPWVGQSEFTDAPDALP